MASITVWNRVEPRPRSPFIGASLAAQVRDPAWFLCRQWQTGELTGQDVGSPAFVTIGRTTSKLTSFAAGSATGTLSADAPLEKQVLAEPFSPTDLALSTEIGQTFRSLLASAGASAQAYPPFLTRYPLASATSAPFNQLDAETAAFMVVCGQQALDGAAVYLLGKQGASAVLPTGVPAGDVSAVRGALASLVTWVQRVWGDLADADPVAWTPGRLDYAVQIRGKAPDGTGVALDAHVDRDGELPWSAFDVSATAVSPPPDAPEVTRETLVPGHVRFRAMASPRFWDFETSELALPSVKAEATDVTKVLTLDFLLIHGADWFVAPIAQRLGTLSRVDAVVVTDVFGAQASIGRADVPTAPPGPSRWTLFTPVTPTALAPYYVCSPSVGSAAVTSDALESVRFARDEMANMAWAIESATASPIGRARSGAERDAAQDAVVPVTPQLSNDTTSPLRYQVETKVPVHWVPLLGAGNPVTALQIAQMARPATSGPEPRPFVPVPALGNILRPKGASGRTSAGYQIADEEVPREGLIVDRVVYRSRWIDGSSHLWIARRRRTGAGETASALRFDVALPTTT